MEPQVIRPQQSSSEPPRDQEVSVSVDHTTVPPQPVTQSTAPTPNPAPAPTPTPLPQQPPQTSETPTTSTQASTTPWQFANDDFDGQDYDAMEPQDTTISWSASEFIAYHKSFVWYLQIFVVLVVVAAVLFFLTRDVISTVSVVLIGILFIVFAGRKPRVLNYGIDESGIHIGEKLYPFASLRSFAVVDEGQLHSITLLPLQRFMPAVSMYFEPQDEAKIVETLGAYLPKEDRKQDMVDRFMHKIRF